MTPQELRNRASNYRSFAAIIQLSTEYQQEFKRKAQILEDEAEKMEKRDDTQNDR